jgi:hypothetical protein
MSDGGFSTDVGQTIAPDGSVSYDFQGHISAQGVDFPAGDTLGAPVDRRMRWLRSTDGRLIADLFAYASVDQVAQAVLLTTYDLGTADRSQFGPPQAILAASGPRNGSIEVTGGQSVIAKVGSDPAAGPIRKQATILDFNGASDFLQAGGTKQSSARRVTVTWPGGVTLLPGVDLSAVFGFTVAGGVATPDKGGIGDAHAFLGNAGTMLFVQTAGFTPPAGTTSIVYVIAWGA